MKNLRQKSIRRATIMDSQSGFVYIIRQAKSSFLPPNKIMKNIIKTLLTGEERAQLLDLAAQMEGILAGKMVTLNDEGRRRFKSVRENNKLLINKVRDFRRSEPAKSSPDIDWEEFEDDYQARLFYEALALHLSSMLHQIQGTKMLHDYDNYQDSLKEYAYTQYKLTADSGGYDQKAAELKQFFNRSGTAGIKRKKNTNSQD